jgi:transketolase
MPASLRSDRCSFEPPGPRPPIIHSADQKFEIGKSVQLTDGKDVTTIADGLLVAEAIRAQEALDLQ